MTTATAPATSKPLTPKQLQGKIDRLQERLHNQILGLAATNAELQEARAALTAAAATTTTGNGSH